MQALQAQVQQGQAGTQQLRAQLRAAEQRSAPGAMVGVEQHALILQKLDSLQQRYDALEREHAALQHRTPPRTADAGEAAGSRPGTAAAMACTSLGDAGASLRSRVYCSAAYGGASADGGDAAAAPPMPARDALQAQLLEKGVQLFDAQLARDQATAEAARQRDRLHQLLQYLIPHPVDADAAAAIAEARELAGLPPSDVVPAATQAGGAWAGGGSKAAGRGGGVGGAAGAWRQGGGAAQAREQELLATIELLKGALERTKKGLESGVPSSRYMAAVERCRQLKARCAAAEAAAAEAGGVREELARVQRELGALHGTCSVLKAKVKAAREGRQEAASAREHMLGALVGGGAKCRRTWGLVLAQGPQGGNHGPWPCCGAGGRAGADAAGAGRANGGAQRLP